MHVELVFVALFSVATLVGFGARWLKVPYTVALVIAGLGLGALRALPAPHLTRDLLYGLLLPGLLFEAAFHLEFRAFWQNRLAITGLAVPGVAVAIGLTAAILTPAARALHIGPGFEVRHAVVLAAVLSATDPIAVVALFKTLGAPKRLSVLVEGESLLNDGTAAVFFSLLLGALVSGHASASTATLDFVRTVGLGLVVGSALGYGASRLIQVVDDPMLEITLTTIAAYGSFVGAESLHASGVIATVAAGMVCGSYGAAVGMSPTSRVAVNSFWEYVAFALNSVVFLLIGLEVHARELLHAWRPILLAYFAVTLARALIVALAGATLYRTRERLPWRFGVVLTWGGLRGALSMVLVLGLPRDFSHRELIVTMTFGVVILSILLQGITMPWLLRQLGVRSATDHAAHEEQRAALQATRAALNALHELERTGALAPSIAQELRADYELRLRDHEARLREMHVRDDDLRSDALRAASRQLLMVEKISIQDAMRDGSLGASSGEAMLRSIDARLLAAEEGTNTPAHEPDPRDGG